MRIYEGEHPLDAVQRLMARNPWLLVAAFIGLVGGGSLFGTGLARAQNETKRAARGRARLRAARDVRKREIEEMAKAGGARARGSRTEAARDAGIPHLRRNLTSSAPRPRRRDAALAHA